MWIGCDNQDLQEDFEAQAFSTPEGFTRTNQSGEALSVDSDDWRTSPAYQADIEITPAFPNPPTAGDLITVPVRIRGTNTVRGSLNLVSLIPIDCPGVLMIYVLQGTPELMCSDLTRR